MSDHPRRARAGVDGDARSGQRLEVAARGGYRHLKLGNHLGRGHPTAGLHQQQGGHQASGSHAASLPEKALTR